jgi:hypothetical protein
MVKQVFLFCFLLGVSGLSFSIEDVNAPNFDPYVVKDGEETAKVCISGESDISLYKNKLPKVKSVQIIKRAKNPLREWEDKARCEKFSQTLKETDIKQYFLKAKEISYWDSRNVLSDEACFVEGKLILSNGKTAEWGVSRLGHGYIVFENQGSGYFYCPSCSQPFELEELATADDDPEFTPCVKRLREEKGKCNKSVINR